jgi:hypothetical protein
VRILFFWLRGICVWISLWGSRTDDFCIFVLDLDPSNSGFGLGFDNFGWNPSFLVELFS